jgi:hypothetical protein
MRLKRDISFAAFYSVELGILEPILVVSTVRGGDEGWWTR